MTEPQLPHGEEELMKTWHSRPGSVPDPADLARQIAHKVSSFDRRIWWRNAREYAACTILLIWTSGGVREGDPAAIMMAAAALGLIGIRWWAHRGDRSVDPDTDALTYQAALLKRHDDQIARMTNVKYWCWIPLYLPIMWITWARWDLDPQRAAMLFASATAGFALIWWVTGRFVLGKLKDARARLAETIDAAS
jgi:hypothetical protein